jgi:hypothetical protein
MNAKRTAQELTQQHLLDVGANGVEIHQALAHVLMKLRTTCPNQTPARGWQHAEERKASGRT